MEPKVKRCRLPATSTKTATKQDGDVDDSSLPPLSASHLVSVSGELGNHIYTYTLVECGPIELTQETARSPPVLNVCKSVRREAGLIHYAENTLRKHLLDYDATGVVAFARVQAKFNNSNQLCMNVVFEGLPNRDNLMTWIEAEHLERFSLPAVDDVDRECRGFAGGLELAETLNDVVWSIKRAALEACYRGLTATDSTWVKDGDRMT